MLHCAGPVWEKVRLDTDLCGMTRAQRKCVRAVRGCCVTPESTTLLQRRLLLGNTEIPLPSNGSLARPPLPPSHSVALLPPRGGHCLRSAMILLYTWCFTAGKTLRTSPRDGLGRPLSRSCVKHPAIPKRSHADKFQVFTERNINRGPEASSL